MSIIERILDRLFIRKTIINCDRDPYLFRWYVIRHKNFAVFIHKFIRSDEDRALHDHPWNFIVIPIWRGYYEHREYRSLEESTVYQIIDEFITPTSRHRILPILGTRFRHGTYRHRVELLKFQPSVESAAGMTLPEFEKATARELPSWSLFIRFREWRDWGFWMPEGWIQWNKWWQEKCE